MSTHLNRRPLRKTNSWRLTLLGGVALTWIAASPSHAEFRTVTLNDVPELVPSNLIGGDREFDGHGPEVKITVWLEMSSDGHEILANVDFWAKETTPDWSEVHETFVVPVYRTPADERILRVVNGDPSVIEFVSRPGGFQFLAPIEDTRDFLNFLKEVVTLGLGQAPIDIPPGVPCPDAAECYKMIHDGLMGTAGNNTVYSYSPRTGPVSVISVVGDMGGDDISNDKNGKDDTRILGISFKPIDVEVKSAGGNSGTQKTSDLGTNSCYETIQGKVAWDYAGHQSWAEDNVRRLCAGQENSAEPGACFEQAMHSGEYGGAWSWRDAIDLCAGSANAGKTLSCFREATRQGFDRRTAIGRCSG